MDPQLTATCPACGERVPVHYVSAFPGSYAEPPEPAWWDWATWHPCALTDAHLDDTLAVIEAQLPTPPRLPLADLPR